jgi:uncharacterized MnhB-related membrane protein
MQVLYAGLTLGALACAILAIKTPRLLTASLWLAALSALLSLFFYLMGAARIAVIELSVGAGLVTVLFVFAIGIAGDATAGQSHLVPRPVSWGLSLAVFLLLGWFIWPLVGAPAPPSQPSLASLLWEGRALDAWVQVVLIFAGVLGVLGLLTEGAAARVTSAEQTGKVMQGEPIPDPQAEPTEIR